MLGVILAGGASRRMGTDKAMVEIEGTSMLEHVAAVLATVCEGLVISGRDSSEPRQGVPDRGEPFRGPLAGFATTAADHPERALLVVGVDQPWVQRETLRRLASRLGSRPVVPVEDGFRQTLCAAYPAGLGSLAAEELEAGGSLQSLLDVTSYDPVSDWDEWGEDGRSWFSVDSPERLAEGVHRFGAPKG
jgi:molybdopterin-guanine dinucleotide biosynthesis protein A